MLTPTVTPTPSPTFALTPSPTLAPTVTSTPSPPLAPTSSSTMTLTSDNKAKVKQYVEFVPGSGIEEYHQSNDTRS